MTIKMPKMTEEDRDSLIALHTAMRLIDRGFGRLCLGSVFGEVPA